MKKIYVRMHFTEDVLGSTPANPDVYRDFIATHAPDPKTIEDEIESLGVDGAVEKGATVFPKENGVPFIFDYQLKGFCKDCCKGLRNVPDQGSLKIYSNKIKSYKQKIDKLIFPGPRKIMYQNYGEISMCQRPLRASTMQGERTALAISESIPAGSMLECHFGLLVDTDENLVREWLDYGVLSGIGQWRNSGVGRFRWEELDEKGKVIGGNMEKGTGRFDFLLDD